ncbi:MAG: GNAT family N-acetyltransferase [Lentisphaerota bacterium]
MNVERYSPAVQERWNQFLAGSKNGTFLFNRAYMEYHADRFEDFSLLVSNERDGLVALLPANRNGDVLSSHGGLTYGGFITDDRASAPLMLEVFDATLGFLRAHGITRVIYKSIPHIYHVAPAEEDAYCLFVKNAALIRRDISTVIDCRHPLPLQERRARSIRKAARQGLRVEEGGTPADFWPLLERNLTERYGLKPVHTAAEMAMLAARFPEQIKFYGAWEGGQLLAGAVVYLSACVCHIQYNASSEEGRRLGAQDLIIRKLIDVYGPLKKFIDFGVSTENSGRVLNAGLIEYKEGFGGRAVNYDFYELGVN